jgi:ApeA N-terminal domain 1
VDARQGPFLPPEQAALERGEEMHGLFRMADRPETETSGVLRWSRESGAGLWLIAPTMHWTGGWPGTSRTQRTINVYGTATGKGTRVTLPGALITNTTFGTGVSEVRLASSQLVLFAHLDPAQVWKRLLLRSANLHEWFPMTGFGQPEMAFDQRGQVRRLTIPWQLPRGRRVPMKDAEIRFAPRMTAEPGPWRPDRSITTTVDIMVTAREAATADELHARFAVPLIDLFVIAGGVPDTITYEALRRGKRSQAVVLRQGPEPRWREWRPDRPLLFYADDLTEFRVALRRWFDLHARLSPAFEVFARSINDDRYTPERLLHVAGSLETYHRVLYERHWWRWWRKQHPASTRKKPSTLLERITHLQRLSGVPESATGLTAANRELLVSSRNHFAHLDAPRYGYSMADVYDNAIPTIRRSVALMQVCIMRQLGFTARDAVDRLRNHYKGWAI